MLTFAASGFGATGFTCVGASNCLPDTEENEARVRALQTLINQIIAKGGVRAAAVAVDGNISEPLLGALKVIMAAYQLGTTVGLDAEILAMGLNAYTAKLTRALAAPVPGAAPNPTPAPMNWMAPPAAHPAAPQASFGWVPYAVGVGSLLGLLLVLRRRS